MKPPITDHMQPYQVTGNVGDADAQQTNQLASQQTNQPPVARSLIHKVPKHGILELPRLGKKCCQASDSPLP